MYSLVISRTHGRYHNWQLIAKELGHHELNNKQCCQRWKCIKHRYTTTIADVNDNDNNKNTKKNNNSKKRSISDISRNGNTSDNDNDEDSYCTTSDNDDRFPSSSLHSVVIHQTVVDEMMNHVFNHETHYHQHVCTVEEEEEVPEASINMMNMMNIMMSNNNIVEQEQGQQQHYREYDVNVEKAFLNQKRKKEPHEVRTKWTPEMVRDKIE